MNLADRCKDAFELGDRERGDLLYLFHDAIGADDFQLVPDAVLAYVSGSHDHKYFVEIDWSESEHGDISMECTCPRFGNGYLCKHIWATVLTLDGRGMGSHIPGPKRLSVNRNGYFFDEGDDVHFDSLPENIAGALGISTAVVSAESLAPEAFRQNAAGSNGSNGSKPRSKPAWQKAFDFVDRAGSEAQRAFDHPADLIDPKDRKAWYLLDVGRSNEAGKLVLSLKQRERKMNGQLSKPQKLPVFGDNAATLRDPMDRELFDLFIANRSWAINDMNKSDRYGYFTYSSHVTAVAIPTANYGYLLPRLVATDRFLWVFDESQPIEDGRPVAWDETNPWQFTLDVAADDERKRWTIGGHFQRDEESREIDQVVLATCGLLLFGDGTLCRMQSDDTPTWMHAIQKQAPVEVPYGDREAFLEHLWSMPLLPRINWPDNLAIEEVRVAPRPKLTIHSPDKNSFSEKDLLADVTFLYGSFGEYEVAISDKREGFLDSETKNGEPEEKAPAGRKPAKPKTQRAKGAKENKKDRNTGRVYLRDRQNERVRLDDLDPFPIRSVTSYYGTSATLRFHQKHLAQIVDRLTALGWHVEAEGKLFRSAGAFNIEVTSGIDWFELDAAFDFEGVEARLPELLAAVRKGAKYVELGDGTRGILPEKWLARYANLANLGEAEDGAIRFKPSQALLLDALLAEQDAEQDTIRLDKKFSRFRKRLQSFDGVKPKDPPKTFCGTLRDYQHEGLGWFHFLRELELGGCLADDMGLGKTVQVLALLENRRTRRLKKGEQRQPSLVIVPKSLVFNWVDEASRFTPKLRVANYTGVDRKQRVGDFGNHHLIVTTYGTLRRDIVTLKDQPFDYAILDESQAIKNANSQAAKASLLLTAAYRLALTGTPIENHLGELWSLFEFLNPGMLGMSSSFTALCRGANRDNHQSLSDLAKAVAPFILRRTKDQVLKELPAKTEQTIHCELSPKERKAYNELRDYYRAKLTKTIKEKGLNQSKIHVLEALLRLRQASCHLGLVDKTKVDQPSAKLETLLQQVREIVAEGHKALVFSQFTSLLAIVRRQLDDEGIRYEYLDGKTRKRKECVQNFQTNPDCPLFLISLKAGGHGLNLTAADYVFILDPWWNPAVEAQAIDRTHRIGQTRRVFAYRIIADNTVEDKVLKLQEGKRELADAIITANDSLIRKLTANDLKMILS